MYWKYYAHMYKNGKTGHAETTIGMQKDKGK
jgi:hypothetical protein